MIGLMMLAAATGGPFIDGNRLLQICDGSPNDQLVCIGYAMGAVDGALAYQQVTRDHLFCLPSMPSSQVRDVIVKFIRDHPAMRGSALAA